MPDAQGRQFARDIAERIGITVSDWRARVSRKHAPAPVDRVEFGGVLHCVWDPQAVELYATRREFRLQPQATIPPAIDCPHEDCDASVTSWAAFSAHVTADHPREEHS
jgi:hypothetical protein